MSRAAQIEKEVIVVLQTLTRRGTSIQRRHRIFADLKLLSDDATAMALDLERKFRVRIPRAEWGTVYTVQDVIELLYRHTTEEGSPSPQTLSAAAARHDG
jgi:acyl carrier protein